MTEQVPSKSNSLTMQNGWTTLTKRVKKINRPKATKRIPPSPTTSPSLITQNSQKRLIDPPKRKLTRSLTSWTSWMMIDLMKFG